MLPRAAFAIFLSALCRVSAQEACTDALPAPPPLLENAQIDTATQRRTFTPQQLDGTEDKAITLKMRNGERQFLGMAYVQSFVLPNVYFHVTTAYGLLRHKSINIGKMDFLGGA